MKRKLLFSILALICLLVTVGLVHRYSRTETPTPSLVEKKSEMGVLVKFKAGIISPNILRHTTDQIQSAALRTIFEAHGVSAMTCVFQNRYDEGGKLKESLATQNFYDLESWQKVVLPSLAEAQFFLVAIKKLPEVEQVQLNEPFELKPAIDPNDPSYTLGQQWHLNSTSKHSAESEARLCEE